MNRRQIIKSIAAFYIMLSNTCAAAMSPLRNKETGLVLATRLGDDNPVQVSLDYRLRTTGMGQLALHVARSAETGRKLIVVEAPNGTLVIVAEEVEAKS